MKTSEILSIVLTCVSALLVPAIVLMIRGAIKWTRVESKLDHAIDELKSISYDKDRVHMEIYTQMREDRAATDKRLRWVEEHIWNNKRGIR